LFIEFAGGVERLEALHCNAASDECH
jgi:hypothetical protein